MTVGFDVGPLAGRLTGIGVAVAALRSALSSRGDVELLPYLTSFRAPRRPDVCRLPLPAALAHRLWSRSAHPRVDRWLARADVIHGTNYVVPPSRRPRLVSVYDCWFLDHPELAGGDVRRAGEVLRRSVRDGATVHACSQATAAAVRRHLPGADVVTIPLGAVPLAPPAARSPLPSLEGRPYVLAVGTLERRKNLPVLVRAFGMIADEHDVQLVIAGGDGDDREAVEASISALAPHARERVLLAGYVPEAERSWLLHHARVLAYPSLDEGFGFPLLDAMQAGVPIVASDAGSIPEVAGAAALLGPPDDAEGLAARLSAAIADEAVRARLLAPARGQLATFSWTDAAARLGAVYRRLAARGAAREVGTG